MKTSLNLLALRSLAVLTAATALLSAAHASALRCPMAPLPGSAPIVSGAGTTIFNPDAAGLDVAAAAHCR